MPDQTLTPATASKPLANTFARVWLLALIALCVVWEALYTPMGTPKGMLGAASGMMALKAFPLLLFIKPIWGDTRRAYQGMTLLVWLYFTEGCVRSWSDKGMSQTLALVEVALSLLLFGVCVARARALKPASKVLGK